MNTNQMVRSSTSYYNEYVICGKTGHTEESGYNLVIYAEKDGVRLISVVMGCEKDQEYVATQSLLDYGFNYFHPVLPAELDRSLNMDNAFTSSPLKIPTRTASILTIDATDTILLPDNVTFDMLEKRVADTENGKLITYTYQDYPLGTVSLLPGLEGNDDPMYETREEEPYVIEEVTALHSIDGWLLLSLATLLLLFILLTFILYHWRYPRKKRRKAF